MSRDHDTLYQMSPRELDHIVATEVLGWKQEANGYWRRPRPDSSTDAFYPELPHFTVAMFEAETVLEHFQESNERLSMEWLGDSWWYGYVHEGERYWHVGIHWISAYESDPGTWRYEAGHQNLPMAICLAAIIAVREGWTVNEMKER